jgi:hypothetical protein
VITVITNTVADKLPTLREKLRTAHIIVEGNILHLIVPDPHGDLKWTFDLTMHGLRLVPMGVLTR